MLSTQPYKGTRDFYPEDKRLQKFLFNSVRNCLEKYGYEEYDAPIVEPIEMFTAKSGEEIVNEQTYLFEDRGGRQVTLRPEMTPSVSRLVAGRRQELAYPLRWYSIPNLWRYERPQRGRLREHWQINVDIFGVDSIEAESELIRIADDMLKTFGATSDQFVIKLNSRKFVDFLFLEYFQLDKKTATKVIKLIDRMHKLEPVKFKTTLEEIISESNAESSVSAQIIELMSKKHIEYLPLNIRSHSSLQNLELLMNKLNSLGVSNTIFDITLMRGFDYYTDVVFEIFDTNPENSRAIMGGGRYDGLVGLFGVEPVATAGFGLGDVTLQDFLTTHKLLPEVKTETDIYTIILGNNSNAANEIITKLRSKGINVAVDITNRKLASKIKTASKKNITFVMFIGDDEIEKNKVVLRNLSNGDEASYSVDEIVKFIKNYRSQK